MLTYPAQELAWTAVPAHAQLRVTVSYARKVEAKASTRRANA